MNTEQIMTYLRTELADIAVDYFTYEELYFAITETVSLLSRMIPNYTVVEISVPTAYKTDEMLDISGAGEFIKLETVEYPIDQNPARFPAYKQWGKYVRLSERGVYFTPDDKVRLFIQAPHTPPTNTKRGSYPGHLDVAVVIGAAGNALVSKAGEYLLKARADVDLKATIDAINALTLPTAPGAPPSLPSVPSAPSLSWTDYPSAPPTFGAAPSAPTLSWDKEPGVSPSLPTAPTAPTLSWTDYTNSLGSAATEIGKATGASGYLTTGAPKIDTVTKGDKVGENYGSYAGVCISSAETYVRKAALHVEKNRTTVIEYSHELSGYNYEASAVLSKYRADIERFIQQIAHNRTLIDEWTVNIQAYVAKTNADLGSYSAGIQRFSQQLAWNSALLTDYAHKLDAYNYEAINKLTSYRAELEKYASGLAGYREELNGLIAVLGAKGSTIEHIIGIADRLRVRGIDLLNNFYRLIGYKAEVVTSAPYQQKVTTS